MARQFMVAVDDSESSAHAVRFAVETLASEGDTIVLVHVRPEVDVEVYYGTPDWLNEVEKNLQKKADEILSKMKGLVHDKAQCELVSLKGDAREKVVDAANEMHPTMLILGNRGFGMVKRAFLGSVSDYAAQHANCPVLIVKLPAAK